MPSTDTKITGLEGFEIGKRVVKGKRGAFEVRGLNTEDLTYLVVNHLEPILLALQEFGEKSNQDTRQLLDKATWPEFLLLLAQHFPELVAEIISRGADEPTMYDKARQLPLPVQIRALYDISELTIEDAGELKNLGAVLASLLRTRGLKLGPLTKRLQTIIGDAGITSAFSSPTGTNTQDDTL